MLTIDALKAESSIPVIIVDHDGIIIHINQMFEKTWGSTLKTPITWDFPDFR
jgi:PAS domain-containing protein